MFEYFLSTFFSNKLCSYCCYVIFYLAETTNQAFFILFSIHLCISEQLYQLQFNTEIFSNMTPTQPYCYLLVFISLITLLTAQSIRTIDNSLNTQFSGFQLQSAIPTTLIQNEVIRVSGFITDPQFYVGDESKAFILELNFTLKNDSNVNFTCRDVFPLQKLKFEISCTLRKAGEYLVGISATPSDQYQNSIFNYTKKYENISNIVRKILPFQTFSLPTTVSKPAPKPEGFELNFIDNNIQLKWTSQASLTNVTFFQINNKTNQLVKKEFLLSGNHQIFYPDFFEFRFFYPGNTSVEISHASSEDGTLSKMSSPFTKEKLSLTFKALRHLKQANSPIRYSVTPALPNMLRVAQRYNFTITFKVRAKTMYFMMSLDYKITRRVKFFRPKPDEEDEVKENVPVTVEIVFDKPGTYLLAFQAADRTFIINQPIYVGEGTPFLPDYFDYYEYLFQNSLDSMLEIEQQYIARYLTDGKIYKDPGFNASIEQQRAYLFELLNYERRKYKANPMTRDQTLEKMAQEHCQDMLQNHYIGVKNSRGEMPINRAIRYNLTSLIRQYAVPSYSLGGLHLDSQINGPKIDITANKMLSRVGIGIVINNEEFPPSYIATYDFTIRDLILSPLEPEQLQKFRQQIIKVMIEKNPNIKGQNKDLSTDISIWIKQNTEYKEEDLQFFLDKKWSSKNKVKVWSREVFFYEEELQNIKDDQAFDNKEGTEIGLGLVVNKESKSTLSAFIVFI